MRKSLFTAQLTRARKTKFPTVYPTMVPNENFEYRYPLSGASILLHGDISLPDATSYDLKDLIRLHLPKFNSGPNYDNIEQLE